MESKFLFEVRVARVRQGMTQDDMAKSLGISRRAYISFEKGESNFRSDERLEKLCDILGLKVPDERKEETINDLTDQLATLKLDLAIIKKTIAEMESLIASLEEA
jgi:DNA-binding XRE family transcriptional regulator